MEKIVCIIPQYFGGNKILDVDFYFRNDNSEKSYSYREFHSETETYKKLKQIHDLIVGLDQSND